MRRRTTRNAAASVAATAALVAGLLATVPATAASDADGDAVRGGAALVTDLLAAGADGQRREPTRRAERPSSPGAAGGQDAEQDPVAPEFQAPLERAAAAAKPVRRVAMVDEENTTYDGRDTSVGPGRLLSRVQVTQDLQKGVLEARATLRAVPTANSLVVAWLGEWDANTCRPRAALGGTTTVDDAIGMFISGGGIAGDFPVTRSRNGAVLTIRSAPRASFKTAGYECAYAQIVLPADDSQPHQQFYAVDLVDQYPPQLAIDRGVPVQGNYRGKWTKVRLEVHNASQSAAPNVVVRARGKGLQFKPKVRKLGKIDRRSTTYGVQFRVRLKPKKAKQRKATFVARSAGHKTTKKVTIAVKPRPRKYKSLAGRYFWGFLPASIDKGWDNRALWFVNRKWVYTDFAPKGNKPKCSKKNKKCKRYKYNARKGVAKIGGKRVKITTEGFRYKVAKKDRAPANFQPTTLAKRNQRFNAKLIRHDFTGICGVWCSTWTEWLSMDKKGRFVLSRMTISSLGPPGVGTIIGNVPPDERGTYRVQKNGKIVLKFADGTTQRHTLAVEHDVRGKASPAGAGLVLGDRNFYLG